LPEESGGLLKEEEDWGGAEGGKRKEKQRPMLSSVSLSFSLFWCLHFDE
jgi:hypothetical protein